MCATGVRHSSFFFFNDTATTEIYTLSLHDALPICAPAPLHCKTSVESDSQEAGDRFSDRKSTRLNSSHHRISYAVFCLKKKHNVVDTFVDALLQDRPLWSESAITA